MANLTNDITVSLKINNISLIEELSDEAATAISGGRAKIIGKNYKLPTLTTPDGDPIDVYVDGVLVNSVTTGYFENNYGSP
jgi:hypothetical protein